MKEHMNGLWGATKWLPSFCREIKLKRRWKAWLQSTRTPSSKCYWTQNKNKSISFWHFLLFTCLRGWIQYSSLFQRASGICLMKKYPFLIGAVTGVMCEPECMFMWWCMYVFACITVCREWQFFSYAPLWRQVIPLLSTEFAVYADKNGKGRTFDVNMPQGLYLLKFLELYFLPQRSEPLCALLFCLTGPSLIWTKKVWGSPLEVLCGYDVILWYLVLFGRLQRGCLSGTFKRTAVLTQSVGCNISLVTEGQILW